MDGASVELGGLHLRATLQSLRPADAKVAGSRSRQDSHSQAGVLVCKRFSTVAPRTMQLLWVGRALFVIPTQAGTQGVETRSAVSKLRHPDENQDLRSQRVGAGELP
jgi:hypothetical protein